MVTEELPNEAFNPVSCHGSFVHSSADSNCEPEMLELIFLKNDDEVL